MQNFAMSSSYTDAQSATSHVMDKKCRICGFADTKNVNIFSANNKTLLTKILTIYPIVLYANDPLPKNICKKCIYNVGLMYNDVHRMLKTQSKWINNVRSNQPNHNYIRVLDLIEHTNNVTRISIKTTLGEDISQESINHLLLQQKAEPYSLSNNKSDIGIVKSAHTSASNSKGSNKALEKNAEIKQSESSVKIKDIQSILELNGCSLLAVDAKNSKKCSSDNKSVDTKLDEITIKEEPIDEFNADNTVSTGNASTVDEDDMKLSQIASAMSNKNDFPTPPPLTVKCRYCPLQFQSLAALASHQLIHMRLRIPKILEKKYLSKKVRRGRLITVHDRKCIRCLNCWRVFIDNKSILDHWSQGECDFYCHICGKEFAQAPKMLREHVPAAHGVSYRSSKVQRISFNAKMQVAVQQMPLEEKSDYSLYKAVSAQEPLPCEETSSPPTNTPKSLNTTLPIPQKAKHAQSRITPTSAPTTSSRKTSKIQHANGKVVCHICFRSFQNIKACNSHMRKHKPSFMYGDVVLPPNAGIDLYTKFELERDSKDETATANTPNKEDNINSQITCPPTQANGLQHGHTLQQNTTTPNKSKITTTVHTNVIRGIRTKFVNRRSDLGNIQVKSITDLQNNTYKPVESTAAVPTNVVKTNIDMVCATDPHSVVIKDEPMDVEDF